MIKTDIMEVLMRSYRNSILIETLISYFLSMGTDVDTSLIKKFNEIVNGRKLSQESFERSLRRNIEELKIIGALKDGARVHKVNIDDQRVSRILYEDYSTELVSFNSLDSAHSRDLYYIVLLLNTPYVEENLRDSAMNYYFKFVENNEVTRGKFVNLFSILEDVLSNFALIDNEKERVMAIRELFKTKKNNIFDMVAHIKINEGYHVETDEYLDNVESTYDYDDGDYVVLNDD